MASFALMVGDKDFRDGTTSASQVERVTAWPTSPSEILRHAPAVYAARKVWSAAVGAQGGADETAFAALAPHGTVQVAERSGHEVYMDAQAVSLAAVQQVLGTTVTKR